MVPSRMSKKSRDILQGDKTVEPIKLLHLMK